MNEHDDAQSLGEEIRSILTPDLLKPKYRKMSAGGRLTSFGHCYAASEALFHLIGGKCAGWTPQNIRHEGESHWFLKHWDGAIVDVTGDQFKTPVLHEEAVGRGFLTKRPSKRAQVIIERVKRLNRDDV